MIAARTGAIALGSIFWVAMGLIGALALARAQTAPREGEAPPQPVPEQIVDYLISPADEIQLRLAAKVPLRSGDPIVTRDSNGRWIQAGYVTHSDYQPRSTAPPGGSGEDDQPRPTSATATWYTEAVDPASCRFVYHYNRGSLGDVVRMMLPPERRERIEHMIREAVELNREELAEAIRPIITRSLTESVPVVERALKESIAAHRDQLEQLGDRYREVIVDKRLVPLVREEVMPSVRRHAEPVAQSIGRELWERASLWRFGWRALYDRSPLPERGLFKDEWDRFVEEEAIPVIQDHTEELVEAQRRIFIDLSQNPRIRAELREVLRQLATDRQLQQLITAIVRESILENRELREVWAENWRREDAQAALRLTSKRLDPVVRKIGDELFGTREGGISPDFARVLRNQVLGKDRRWIVAHPVGQPLHASSGPIPVDIARQSEPYPLLILAAPEEDPLR